MTLTVSVNIYNTLAAAKNNRKELYYEKRKHRCR